MLNDQFIKILARKLSVEASPDELNELQDILVSDPDCQYLADLLSVYWKNSPDFLNPSPFSLSKDHFESILARAKQIESGKKIPLQSDNRVGSKAKVPLIKHFSLAAATILLITISYLLLRSMEPKQKIIAGENKKTEVSAGRGAKSHLFLPDGSQVWLNSESKLIYREMFNDSVREVELEGEAFFDVKKDKDHPFIVHTSDIDIRVLGTTFNVKSYPLEATIEATLIHGMIEIVNQNAPKAAKIILHPHDKIIFDKNNKLLANENRPEKETSEMPLLRQPGIVLTVLPKDTPDTAIIETSWVNNKLMFEGDTFQELAIKMERWYNTRIYFKNQQVANYRLRGAFRNENLEQALQALKLIASFNYKINGSNVEISKD